MRKRQRTNPKFFFFDIGVQRALTSDFSLEYGRGSLGYGYRFEHFIITEILRMNEYLGHGYDLSFIRESDDKEVDLVLSHPNGKVFFIEIKSADVVRKDHCEKSHTFQESISPSQCLLLSLDPIAKQFDQVRALDWRTGIDAIFNLNAAPS